MVWMHTRNSTTCTTPSQVVNNCGIAFDNTVNAQVASKPSICDLLVFETLDRNLDGNGGISSGLEITHG